VIESKASHVANEISLLLKEISLLLEDGKKIFEEIDRIAYQFKERIAEIEKEYDIELHVESTPYFQDGNILKFYAKLEEDGVNLKISSHVRCKLK
jgi:hypothetical protein